MLGYKDSIIILSLKSSNYVINLVQLPLSCLPPLPPPNLSDLVTLQMWNANTFRLNCCLKNTTKQRFTLSYISVLSTSLPQRRIMLFDSKSLSRCNLGKECADKGSKQKENFTNTLNCCMHVKLK